MLYRFLADIAVLIHFLFILFLLGGLVLILLGLWRRWSIARSLRFRLLHLCGFLLVVGIEIAGYLCPLTYLENWLRQKQDPMTVYFGSFVAHYLEELIYLEVPLELIVLPTMLFALFTLVLFFIAPPKR